MNETDSMTMAEKLNAAYEKGAMRDNETLLTLRYWQEVGGAICFEFRIIEASRTNQYRRADALILPDGPTEIVKANEITVLNRDVIVVQKKKGRIGMYLIGQTSFSRDLMLRHSPKSVKSVAICGRDDTVMRELWLAHPHMEVAVINSDSGEVIRHHSK